MKVNEMNFRQLYHQLWYITMDDKLQFLVQESNYADRATGVLAYGYIDHEAGFTFEIIACAEHDKANGKLNFFGDSSNASLKYRYGNLSDNDIYPINNDSVRERFAEKINLIDNGYKVSEEVMATRELVILDENRNPKFPDDVMVILLRKDIKPEGCWVRCESLGDDRVKGVLLNEPYGDFNVHCGDLIEFQVIKNDDKTFCAALIK